MTLINRMLKQAMSDNPPDELTVNSNNVGTVVNHITSQAGFSNIPYEKVREELIAGRWFMCGVKIRVVGQHDR